MTKTPIPEIVIFGDSGPRNNRLATQAFRVAVVSMTPILALVLGPVAIVMGMIALKRYRANKKDGGMPQGRGAIILGAMSAISNAIGIYCLWRGQSVG